MKAHGDEFSQVARCVAPVRWASRSGGLAQSSPSRTQMESLSLLSGAAGKASPAAGWGGMSRPSGMCFGKAWQGMCSLATLCDWVTHQD